MILFRFLIGPALFPYFKKVDIVDLVDLFCVILWITFILKMLSTLLTVLTMSTLRNNIFVNVLTLLALSTSIKYCYILFKFCFVIFVTVDCTSY